MPLYFTELADRVGIVVNLNKITIKAIGGKHMMPQGTQTGLVSTTDTAIIINAINAMVMIAPYNPRLSSTSKMFAVRRTAIFKHSFLLFLP
jgi:hypothetical protein